ncbi:MAG: flagellar brake protein [Rubrivivax sp.]|nr:flagellar brake protein [Rubrivivax sp.]
MRADIQPAPAPAPPAAAAHDAFRVTDAAERLALLAQLRDSGAAVLLHTADGASLRSRLASVDAGASRLSFAVAAAELESPHLASLLEDDDVTAVAHPGQVKLQFDAAGLVLVRGQASAVLQCALPDEMLRVQRRETFRVCPPVTAPVAMLRHPAIPEMTLALRVLDLSLGGCALRLPDDVPALAPGTRLAGVTIELDVDTRLRVELLLQHVTYLPQHDEAGASAGPGSARLGCEWRLQRPEDERALQRWIDQAQVRQRISRRAAAQRAAAGAAARAAVPAAVPWAASSTA